MGGRGSGGASGGGARKTFEKASQSKAEEMLQKSFVSDGMDSQIADDVANAISWHRNESGSDGGTTYKNFSPSERRTMSEAYSNTLQKYGLEGEFTIRKVKVAGSKSRLKGGFSTGATYEIHYDFNWKPKK